jgi:uncharacterized membrane protein YphA (DoxX/SURF4 family)
VNKKTTHKVLTILIALVWIVNGLFCKVLNLVPRHREIVGHILGEAYSAQLTMAIGISEILMAVWILTDIKSRLNVIVQVLVIAVMNIMEFILVPELLLFGRFNALVALLFIVVILYNQFAFNRKAI